ncbi:MAG: glycosyltransferase family 4 protein [Geobacteraceae bacterium]
MKILLVNNDKGWGGGQEHLKSLAEQLSRQGFNIHFSCRSGSPSETNFSAMGYPVHPFSRSLLCIIRTTILMPCILRREKFDIVMVTREHDLAAIALAWKLAFPLVRTGKLVMCYHTATSRRQMFFGAVDAVACVSSFIRDKLLTGNKRIEKAVAILHNGVPVADHIPAEKFKVERKRRFFHGMDFPLIGMVCAFFKNQAELVEMIPILKQKFPTIKIAFIGDDSDLVQTTMLMDKVRQLGVMDSVIFTGKVPHERLTDIYFDLDLSVSTFRSEGFGLVHLESLAAGTPVVTYNAGGQIDIFSDGGAGVLVDGGIKEFASVVVDLLSDNERRFAMGAVGRKLVNERFSVEHMAETYSAFFRRLQKKLPDYY